MNDKIEAVQRMQDYIEDHQDEVISLADLSKVAHFSPWYAAKIFKELIGLSPMDYIRRLKLANSALKLRDKKAKVIDIAYDVGFESVDGYQRAFYKEFKCNPKEYSRNPTWLSLFTPYGVKFKEKWKENVKMENVKNVFIQVINKPTRKVIIKRGIKADEYMSYCEEVGCDVWGILKSIQSIEKEPICLWLPEKYRQPNTSSYVQGIEVPEDYVAAIPDGFDIMTLPASQYLMFQGEPFAEEDYCEAIVAVQNAIEKYDPTLIGYKWDDENPRIQLEPIGKRGYIELKAII